MEILTGLTNVLSDPSLILAVLAAAVIGMLVGAIPGLTASAAIAMLVPLTFFMEPLFALAFLYVIGKSGRYGGSIAAILFNTPGTAASAATRIDGHPLARQGKAGKALKVATLASVVGDTIGELLLIFGVGMIAALALMLGPPELFAIYAAAFVVIGAVIGQSVIKGLASAALGVLLRMVGLDPISAEERFTFGQIELADGIGLVPLMIGVFVYSMSDFGPPDRAEPEPARVSEAKSPAAAQPSPEAQERAQERQRMKPYEDLRTIDGHAYRADAYEVVVTRLASNSCQEGNQKLVDMAAFSKSKLRGISVYQILMDIEKELRGLPKRECADVFASYILLNGGG